MTTPTYTYLIKENWINKFYNFLLKEVSAITLYKWETIKNTSSFRWDLHDITWILWDEEISEELLNNISLMTSDIEVKIPKIIRGLLFEALYILDEKLSDSDLINFFCHVVAKEDTDKKEINSFLSDCVYQENNTTFRLISKKITDREIFLEKWIWSNISCLIEVVDNNIGRVHYVVLDFINTRMTVFGNNILFNIYEVSIWNEINI